MIFIAAGTKDARIFVEKLKEKTDHFLVSTFSQYGKELYEKTIPVRYGAMDKEELISFFEREKISQVVDMTHPYAKKCSQNLIEASQSLGIPYWRYERPSQGKEGIHWVKDMKEAAGYIKESEKKTMLTIGTNGLDFFLEIPKEQLILRILPTEKSISKAEGFGFLPRQIVAIQGPFSQRLNEVLLKEYGVELLLTKESGDIGGFLDKVEACLSNGVEVVCIQRPEIFYPQKTDSIEELLHLLSL